MSVAWCWRPGNLADFQSWSHGQVKDISDLYKPSIFGPSADSRCECGRYSGPSAEGTFCERCRVRVSSLSLRLRKTRLGHVALACSCTYPWPSTESWFVDAFPVLPIYYRVGPEGQVNEIGRKYEELVALNGQIAQSREEAESMQVWDDDSHRLSASLEAIVGRIELDSTTIVADRSTLVGLLMQAIGTFDEDLSVLARSAGWVLQLDARV